MTENLTFPHFITTYQRVFLSDWTAIAKLIFKHSALLKEGGYNEENFKSSPTNVLSEQQIQNALLGPYSTFFLNIISTFSIIARLRMASYIEDQDNIKDNLTPLDKTLVLDKSDLERFPSDEIAKILESLEELMNTQNQQWEGQLFFWQMSLTGALNAGGLSLNELETDEFNSAEPMSELLERYDVVNITPPKVAYPLSFADYFKLKAYLAVLSALSRQHLPNDEKQIEKNMKTLKKPLADIEKAEKQLAKQQLGELDVITDTIRFARFDKKK